MGSYKETETAGLNRGPLYLLDEHIIQLPPRRKKGQPIERLTLGNLSFSRDVIDKWRFFGAQEQDGRFRRLEVIMLNGELHTSIEEIQRFLEATKRR
jgi:hypothetical protein